MCKKMSREPTQRLVLVSVDLDNIDAKKAVDDKVTHIGDSSEFAHSVIYRNNT